MQYIVRLNPRAWNPLTKRVDAARLWEVEQVANKDSERVIWHCADVRIGELPIRMFFTLPKAGEPPTELKFSGICTRGQDNAICIYERRHDVV